MAQKQTKSTTQGTERRDTAVVKPRAARPRLGFARSKDLHDRLNPEQGARSPGKQYDRTGDKEYAEGMESFEKTGGGVRRSDRERSGTSNRKRPPD